MDGDAYTSQEKGRDRMRLRHLGGTLEDALFVQPVTAALWFQQAAQ